MLHTLARLARRLRLFAARRSFERDLDEELRFHVEMATSHRLARGIPKCHCRIPN